MPKLRVSTFMHPVLRAQIAQSWAQTAVDAQIHAILGDNSDQLVNKAGRIFFVVLGAVMAEPLISQDSPDVRILRDGANALFEQAGVGEIDDQRRASIHSGLLAAQRLAAALPRKALTDSACNLHVKLKTGHVHMSDFATA